MSLLNSIWENRVEDKEDLEQEFLTFLRELGYPEGSLFRGPSFQLRLRGQWREAFLAQFGHPAVEAHGHPFSCYADLGILELDTSQYAALVEFRMSVDEDAETRLATVFEAVMDHVQTRPSIYLVTPANDHGFVIRQMQENGNWRPVQAKDFPSHAALTTNFAASRALNEESSQARNLDRFALTCRLLAGVVGALTLSSIIGVRPLTVWQISMLIVAALLLIAPEALGFSAVFGKHRPRTSPDDEMHPTYGDVARRTRSH